MLDVESLDKKDGWITCEDCLIHNSLKNLGLNVYALDCTITIDDIDKNKESNAQELLDEWFNTNNIFPRPKGRGIYP